MPLAVADTNTVDRGDCIATDNVKTDGYVGEYYNVKYNQNQRFYYLSDQCTNECWLLYMAQYDAKQDYDQGMRGISTSYHGTP